jgi:hypothetical protein
MIAETAIFSKDPLRLSALGGHRPNGTAVNPTM